MKRITLILCILFSLISCEIQYDGETKIVVTGKIIDQNGNPIPEKNIDITIYSDDMYTPSDLISYGKSDQNGNFTLIFPAPKVDYKFSVSINNLINQTSEFQAKEIIAKKINFENYKLDLDKITLYKRESITTLKLILNHTSTNKQLKDIEIEGKQANSYIDLNPLQNNSDYLNTYYSVVKNQTILLKYTIIDHSNAATPTAHSISIPIINDAVTYTITY
ncbi:Ig-like domain-containing protein [Flavobacterium limnophilum]|uniref:Ig-like domain-containing protein n=1 Tax=Flavobacterium limnophilum TaxID=3003262 RepID=UPI0022AC6F90|nr:Ig-like domain-containing protein [Flavobacterium limnophilum]